MRRRVRGAPLRPGPVCRAADRAGRLTGRTIRWHVRLYRPRCVVRRARGWAPVTWRVSAARSAFRAGGCPGAPRTASTSKASIVASGSILMSFASARWTAYSAGPPDSATSGRARGLPLPDVRAPSSRVPSFPHGGTAVMPPRTARQAPRGSPSSSGTARTGQPRPAGALNCDAHPGITVLVLIRLRVTCGDQLRPS